jgi:predicted Zn-dependent peptidase
VIRNVPAATIKAFYDKFYTPDNMAVVVVGDIPDLEEMIDSLEEVMGACQPHCQEERPTIPR